MSQQSLAENTIYERADIVEAAKRFLNARSIKRRIGDDEILDVRHESVLMFEGQFGVQARYSYQGGVCDTAAYQDAVLQYKRDYQIYQMARNQYEAERASAETRAEQAQKAGLELDSLRLLPLAHEILLSGQVEAPPQNLISVSMPMPGLLRSTRLLPGMKVKKGEIQPIWRTPLTCNFKKIIGPPESGPRTWKLRFNAKQNSYAAVLAIPKPNAIPAVNGVPPAFRPRPLKKNCGCWDLI